ncbi:MAG: FtsX-like permease family protein [Chromatiales bacterium]|nr:FtsX-like permease family protein [Chromatiales bacterium]
MSKVPTRSAGVVARLAMADLRHEWILTLCLVLAIAAVIAPLLLLMGLKHGTIATLRHELIQDPQFREIRPTKTQEYAADWFTEHGALQQVEYLVPTILAASSIISVVKPGTRRSLIYDLLPAEAGDPLLLGNGAVVPREGQCVLTDAGAKELGVKVGDQLRVQATRILAGRREAGTQDLEVVAVLSPRASSLNRLYAPLGFVLDVEAYKEGLAVPARGWSGGTPRPYPSYDGVLVLLPRPLSPVQESGLVINTGLTRIEKAGGVLFHRLMGLDLPGGYALYDLSTSQKALLLSSVQAVRDKLRGKEAMVLPYVRDLHLRLGPDRDVPVYGISVTEEDARRLGMERLPWGSYASAPRSEQLLQIRVEGLPAEQTIEAVYGQALETPLAMPLRAREARLGQPALVPAELAGVLRTAQQRAVVFDRQRQDFVLQRAGYRGFRMYTRSIDEVLPMVDRLRAEGIEVIAQIEAIERVQVLDRGLNRIFWLVAIVGISGGIAALIASLYAAVERKQHELSVLRLIGLARRQVFRFPVYQGGTLALLSVGLALVAYFSLAGVINRAFAADLDLGERICELPPTYLLVSVVATLGVAVLSSLLAAWRTTTIDPGEALRYE